MNCKNHVIANPADQPVMIAFRAKVAVEPGFRDIGADRSRIESSAGNSDRALIGVRGEDNEAPVNFLTFELFMK